MRPHFRKRGAGLVIGDSSLFVRAASTASIQAERRKRFFSSVHVGNGPFPSSSLYGPSIRRQSVAKRGLGRVSRALCAEEGKHAV